MELGNTSPLLPPANPSLSTLAWDLGQWLPPQSLCIPICPVGTGNVNSVAHPGWSWPTLSRYPGAITVITCLPWPWSLLKAE